MSLSVENAPETQSILIKVLLSSIFTLNVLQNLAFFRQQLGILLEAKWSGGA
jgi:hypothetical protein